MVSVPFRGWVLQILRHRTETLSHGVSVPLRGRVLQITWMTGISDPLTFPSPYGEGCFKFEIESYLIGKVNVSVPLRGRVLQIGASRAIHF